MLENLSLAFPNELCIYYLSLKQMSSVVLSMFMDELSFIELTV